MDDESEPVPPPQTRQTPRNRARPSMGGSGLFGTPKPINSPPPTLNSEDTDMSEMIQQVSFPPDDSSPKSIPNPIISGESSDFHRIFKKIGTRIHMDGLTRSNGGIIAQLDPNTPGIVHMSKRNTILSELNSTDVLYSNLGMSASQEAPDHHRLIFVLLAQLSLNNPGKAAVILTHSPWTIAATSNEDIFVLDASDLGLGRIAIIDEGTEENQIAEITEAVTQMNGLAIIIRNQFALGFGTELESIASYLTKLEHEMQRKHLRNQ